MFRRAVSFSLLTLYCCFGVLRGDDGVSTVEQLSRFLESGTIREVCEQSFAHESLSQGESDRAKSILVNTRRAKIVDETKSELEKRTLKIDDLEMPFWFKSYGEAPATGHSLYISMHGGGGAPKRVNDQQWQNQQRLYQPEEGIYVAPRAPTDSWNLWHKAHIDQFFDRMIEMMVAHFNVNPNRVYLMGYSAGGDGVYQLAPRMADRFAAASMMAGHPNDASPLSLRNLGFALFMGGKDGAYKRNLVAGEWKEKLAQLRLNDPNGYVHEVTIYPDLGHWMQRRDAVAVPWMAERHRNEWPERVVWLQDDVGHRRLYWLQIAPSEQRTGSKIIASYGHQTIQIETDDYGEVTLLLSDEIANLDSTVTVIVNGKSMRAFSPKRTVACIARSISNYGIARPIPAAEVRVSLSR